MVGDLVPCDVCLLGDCASQMLTGVAIVALAPAVGFFVASGAAALFHALRWVLAGAPSSSD